MGDIASSCNMNCSTIGTIPKKMDKVMEREVHCADDVDNMKEAWKSDGRDRLLGVWRQDKHQCQGLLSLMLIQEKAKSLYEDFNTAKKQ